MESAVPMLVLLGFLFVSMILILALGYQSREEERRSAETAQAVQGLRVLEGPRFFARMESPIPSGPVVLDSGALLRHLEEHLRYEHRIADDFARHPSVDRFVPAYAAHAERVARELELHIRSESLAATAFVQEPSAMSLYGAPALPAGALVN
jgi:hypothetical protein